MKEFRYHPEIEGLKVNADGSQIYLNDNLQEIKVKKNGNYPFRFIYYKGKNIGLARLVLECWGSMPPTPKLTAKHIDSDYTNYYYKNLQWGTVGGNAKYPNKLNAQQKNEILEKVKEGKGDSEIAREYGVTRNAIFNLRKKHQKQNG